MSALPCSTRLPDLDRRFGGVARLYGEEAAAQIRASHIVIVGLGGVGSWAAEALARSGVGELTLIDLDHVAESNINRQIQALDSTLGMAKVRALAVRIADINPACTVHEVEDFASPDNLASIIPASAQAVLDCCDQARTKAALAAYALQTTRPIVMVGAAGGKRQPQQTLVLDLAEVRNDPLLAKVRYRMRRTHGAPRSGAMCVACVCSAEPVFIAPPDRAEEGADQDARPCTDLGADLEAKAAQPPQGLNCAGYGSSIMVTATFGMVAASLALEALLRLPSQAMHRT